MESIIQFLAENKEWLFSGVGVVVIVGVLRFFFTARRGTSTNETNESTITLNSQMSSDPQLVILPNGEAMKVEGIDGVKISGRTGLLNVCLVWKSPGHVYEKSIYHTYSRRKAERFARETAKAINSVRK
ncbi:MAG: hypothetical protein AABY58_07440 [Nitrospirota bacterium]|mgnify:CR=1 FL=1